MREHLLGRSPDLGRVREAGVIQFVMIRESSIERRPKPWNVKMAMHRGGMGRRDMPMLLGDFLLFFCLAAWVSGMVIAIASLLS